MQPSTSSTPEIGTANELPIPLKAASHSPARSTTPANTNARIAHALIWPPPETLLRMSDNSLRRPSPVGSKPRHASHLKNGKGAALLPHVVVNRYSEQNVGLPGLASAGNCGSPSANGGQYESNRAPGPVETCPSNRALHVDSRGVKITCGRGRSIRVSTAGEPLRACRAQARMARHTRQAVVCARHPNPTQTQKGRPDIMSTRPYSVRSACSTNPIPQILKQPVVGVSAFLWALSLLGTFRRLRKPFQAKSHFIPATRVDPSKYKGIGCPWNG